ncbi:MAG: rhodanese-related sulfurtransferase [Litorivicinus sp.]
MDTTQHWDVAALYRFASVPNAEQLRQPLLELAESLGLCGTLILGLEGINGTIAGKRSDLIALLNKLGEWQPALANLAPAWSESGIKPFFRFKVKVKKEIVTLDVEGADPNVSVGTYCDPDQWDAVISDPDVVVIDTRNDYEFQVGTFDRAINPKTKGFREFPTWVDDNLDPAKHKKVAMFCTGGIRCEKGTSMMLNKGFDEVYHLKGGILGYLRQRDAEHSKWRGECYVFDQRVSLKHRLEQGSYSNCGGCRMPLSEADREHPNYEKGVQCGNCVHLYSEDDRKRFGERVRQQQLAAARGEAHLGLSADALKRKRQQARALRQARSSASNSSARQ